MLHVTNEWLWIEGCVKIRKTSINNATDLLRISTKTEDIEDYSFKTNFLTLLNCCTAQSSLNIFFLDCNFYIVCQCIFIIRFIGDWTFFFCTLNTVYVNVSFIRSSKCSVYRDLIIHLLWKWHNLCYLSNLNSSPLTLSVSSFRFMFRAQVVVYQSFYVDLIRTEQSNNLPSAGTVTGFLTEKNGVGLWRFRQNSILSN